MPRMRGSGFVSTTLQSNTMHAMRIRSRFATWMAILAMLASALAPAVSHAVAAWGGSTWQDICRSPDSRVTSGESGERDRLATLDHAFEHCGYCALNLTALELPPTPSLALPNGLSDTPPAAFFEAPRPLFAWSSAQPRAPPRG